jgi:pyruvate-ferredoxin/flavodoxin oxidoreductase
MYMENRFKMLTKSKPDAAKAFLEQAQADVDMRWAMYEYLAKRSTNGHNEA